MRIFVLCTGRCGSMTFAKACSHITNYTSAHESGRYVDWSYQDNHIEVDNRLSWFLGTLAERYPDSMFVHLSRNRDAVIESFTRRQTLRESVAARVQNWNLPTSILERS